MHFADVILPLPLDGLFTYSVPQPLEEQVKFGVRVQVPFGRSKHYVGIVARTHDEQPQGYVVKDIQQVLDVQPILLPEQYRLWSWIAEYYIASLLQEHGYETCFCPIFADDGDEILPAMCRCILRAKNAGIYNGAYEAVKLAVK